jgi:hypothetical protein
LPSSEARDATLAERLGAGRARAEAWDALSDQLTGWSDDRLDAAQLELAALIGDLEGLEAEVSSVAPSLVSDAAIALRYAHAVQAWIRSILHERLPPADLDALGGGSDL